MQFCVHHQCSVPWILFEKPAQFVYRYKLHETAVLGQFCSILVSQGQLQFLYLYLTQHLHEDSVYSCKGTAMVCHWVLAGQLGSEIHFDLRGLVHPPNKKNFINSVRQHSKDINKEPTSLPSGLTPCSSERPCLASSVHLIWTSHLKVISQANLPSLYLSTSIIFTIMHINYWLTNQIPMSAFLFKRGRWQQCQSTLTEAAFLLWNSKKLTISHFFRWTCKLPSFFAGH